jgi:phospholipase D1/2
LAAHSATALEAPERLPPEMTQDGHPRSWDALLRPGETCWRIERASRAAVIVETADYFGALCEACAAARRSILILGWDFDRRERVGRADDDPTFEEFFCALLEQRSSLHIHLLSWDYAFVYAAEREWFQELHLRHRTHERLHVKFDGAHPAGASQHQKIVVIDDRLAFCGGIDLSLWRCDTADHAPDDGRRTDPDGKAYPPFHDAMMLVEGPAAAALGDLARERWQRTGADTPFPDPPEADSSGWPDSVEPGWTDASIGIARTFPEWGDCPAVDEVERLYLESVRLARRYIYIENQYFTSRTISEALVQRLEEAGGPDIVLVLPHHTGGWLEQVTMDAIRAQRMRQLVEADREGRLRICYPYQPGLADDECISVHAKLMLADDRLVRVGSANTSNRSMGLDSECDLVLVDGAGDGAAGLLHRLLAEHLDCTTGEIARARDGAASIVAAIDGLRSDTGRSLRLLALADENPAVDLAGEEDVIDPEEPIDTAFLVRRAVPQGAGRSGHRRLYLFIGFIVLLLLLGASWRWTPLGDSLTAERLASALALFESPWVRFGTATAVIAVTTLLMVPLTPLVVASAILLGPWLGFASSMTGAMLSAAVGFIGGERMGGQLLERYSESRVHRLSRRLSDRGILAVAVLRMVPVAPYTVVNVVAGASHLQLGRFLLGTLIGMVPGLAALTWFSDSLYRAVTEPGPQSVAVLIGATAFIGLGAWLLRRLLKSS